MTRVFSRPSTTLATYAISVGVMALAIRKYGDRAASREIVAPHKEKPTKDKKQASVGVDMKFFNQLMKLLKICVPGPFSKQTAYAVLVLVCLLGRTAADIWSITVQTKVEASIIHRDREAFIVNLGKFIVGTLPTSLVNSLLKYALSELQLLFRTSLSEHLLKQYLNKYTFYQITNLDNRVPNPDQLLTADVDKFCNSIVELYSNVSKPILDIALYSAKLSNAIGPGGPAIMISYLLVTGAFLTWLRRPIGRFTVREQQLEGEYRHVNSRLIASSEEIAFYEGTNREMQVILGSFRNLTNHMRIFQQFRHSVGFVDTLAAKYFATALGFYILSRPFFGSVTSGKITSSYSQNSVSEYYRSGRMLLAMAAAVGRLVLAGRELTRLAGFTSRMHELITVLKDLNNGKYMRTVVNGEANRIVRRVVDSRSSPSVSPSSSELSLSNAVKSSGSAVITSKTELQSSVSPGVVDPLSPQLSSTNSPKPTIKASEQSSVSDVQNTPNTPVYLSMLQNNAHVVVSPETDNSIQFDSVPLSTPNGDILLPSLSFRVAPGENVLVAGPNGCGKSSLFRTLRGIWPQAGGKISRPPTHRLFYVPQRPYLSMGSLRDQLTYPDGQEERKRKGVTDEFLLSLLEDVKLEYLFHSNEATTVSHDNPKGNKHTPSKPVAAQKNGLDAVMDWSDVLSGGEKQRLAMARVFYHRPLYAILDECTSAVSVDVEGAMYSRCAELGITLFTVSHRKSLWRHHQKLLRFDGNGGYVFRDITEQEHKGDSFGS